MAALLVWMLIGFPSDALAAVYKCTGEGGGAVYQDTACPPGKELRNFTTDPPNVSIVPGTPETRLAPPVKMNAAAPAERRAAKQKVQDAKAAARRFVQIGMSEAEVIERFGRPQVDSRARKGQGKQWSYLPAPGDPETITTLTIVGGKVVDVERKIVR